MNFLYELLLQPLSEVNLVIFRKSGETYDYVSILPHPPSHLVSKRKHTALPTHLFDYVIFEWSLIKIKMNQKIMMNRVDPLSFKKVDRLLHEPL